MQVWVDLHDLLVLIYQRSARDDYASSVASPVKVRLLSEHAGRHIAVVTGIISDGTAKRRQPQKPLKLVAVVR